MELRRTGSLAFLAVVPLVPLAAVADAQAPVADYVVSVSNQGAGGDPGFLYAGGPQTVRLSGPRAGEAFELCLSPAPIDAPACRAGATGRSISGVAPSSAGRTEYRFILADGRVVTRRLRVAENAGEARAVTFRPGAAARAVYSGRDVAVVVRLARSLPREGPQRPAFLVAPRLVRGEVRPDAEPRYGGLTPSRIGRAQRHCYVAEATRPRPLARLRDGTRSRVGLLDGESRVAQVAPLVVRRSGGDGEDLLTSAARRLGCLR